YCQRGRSSCIPSTCYAFLTWDRACRFLILREKAMKKILFVLTVMCFAPLASAQQVALGNAMFELGAPRAQVLSTAQARFSLVPSKRRGQYTVYPRQAPGERRL